MVASRQSPPLLSPDDTLAVIRSRIEEKRLFEARFLCRKLGQGLTAEQKAALEQELADSLGRADRLRREAKGLIARGEHGAAGALYTRLGAIVIDLPGVDDEIKALAGAEALAARLSKPVEEEAENESAPVPPREREGMPFPAPSVERSMVRTRIASGPVPRKKLPSAIWWLAVGVGGVVLCALIVFVLFWGVSSGGKKNPAVAPRQPERIVVQPPAASPGEEAFKPQPSAETPIQPVSTPTAPPVEKREAAQEKTVTTPPQSGLKLGTLQIEQSGRR